MRISGVANTIGSVRVVNMMSRDVCCAWHNPGYNRPNLSHGICKPCAKETTEEIKNLKAKLGK